MRIRRSGEGDSGVKRARGRVGQARRHVHIEHTDPVHSMKVPSESKLYYESSAVSNQTYTAAGKINLVRDLAVVNRHNVTHTNTKGVPYVLRCAVTVTPLVATASGSDYAQVSSEDANQVKVIDIETIPNSWVARNAGVKTHAARENMFKQQGIKKKERGAYSKTVRYTYAASPDTFLTPKSGGGSGTAYTMGTWDYSALRQDDASLAHLPILGNSGIMSLYLDSRKQIDADSNSDSDDTNQPADNNILRSLLSPTLGISNQDDEVTALGRDEQDNPPYQLDNNGDAIETIRAHRFFLGHGTAYKQTAVIDVPYGMMEFKAINAFKDAGSDITDGFNIHVEVLGMYEM